MYNINIMKKIILTIVFLLFSNTITSAQQSIIENDLKNLTLSFAQRTSIEKIKQDYLGKYKSTQAQLNSTRQTVKAKIDAQASGTEIKSLQTKVQKLQMSLADMEVQYLSEIQKILDNDQIKVLRQMSFH